MEFFKPGSSNKSNDQGQRTNLPYSPPSGGGPSMEVAHVLFLDVVGYSTLRINQQASAQLELQKLVSSCDEVRDAIAERKFICRPAGDGMALLFFRDIASPVRTALEIHQQMDWYGREIQSRVGTPLKLRMGIHSGVVMMVEDLNAQSDAAGEGINIAQRVMDCGDADHILISDKVAKSLLHVDPWQHYLRDLGDCRVKHGVVVHLYLLHGRLTGNYYGNVAVPRRVAAEQDAMERDANRYRGTYFENHPEMRGRLTTFAVIAGLFFGCNYAWKNVPAFKTAVQSAYAGVTGHPAAKPSPKMAAKHSSGHHSGRTATAHSSSHESRRAYSGDDGMASRVLVPDLLGKGVDEAAGIVENQGLRLAKNPTEGYNTQYGQGLIYDQSPASGDYTTPGSQVTVHISKGDPPDAVVPGAEAAAGGQ